MAFLKLTSLILQAAHAASRGGRIVVYKGKAKCDRLICVPGPGLDIIHRRTFHALKDYGLIRLERVDRDATRYKLTDLGKMLVDDLKGFRRLNREAHSVRGQKRPFHDVDCSTRCCRKCGRALAQLLAELDREGDVRPCVTAIAEAPPAIAIQPGDRLALSDGKDPYRTRDGDAITDAEYEDTPKPEET